MIIRSEINKQKQIKNKTGQINKIKKNSTLKKSAKLSNNQLNWKKEKRELMQKIKIRNNPKEITNGFIEIKDYKII